MKELVLMINQAQDCSYIEDLFYGSKKDNYEFKWKIEEIKNSLKGYLSTLTLNRVYFGSEFCQFLLPSINDVRKVFDYALEKNLKISFVTPIVTDYGIKKLINLFEYISQNYKDVEIIFNDWGVLELVKEKFNHFTCIAGRLIDKTLRDPRISPHDYESTFSENGLKYLRRPSIVSTAYKKLLNIYDVSRVELDFLPQGFDFENSEISPLSLSVYLPFGYVTTGRQCMMRMLDLENADKFILNDKCNRACKKYAQIMYKRQGTFIGDLDEVSTYNVELYRKGNTVFYSSTNLKLVENMDCFDRIVYQPTLSI